MTDHQETLATELALDAAQARLINLITPINQAEDRPLHLCHGAILSQDMVSPINMPPSDTAAVDGYAFRHADLMAKLDHISEHALPISGKAHAGHPLTHAFIPETAIYITTGTPMPVAANPDHNPDTIAMQEHCEITERHGKTWVTLPKQIKPNMNFRPAGENIRSGETALTKGTYLGSAEIGLAAAIGQHTLSCMKTLRIGILSNGEELHDISSALSNPHKALEAKEAREQPGAAGHIYDSNRPMLNSLVKNDGYIVHDGGIIADHPDQLTAAMLALTEACDAVIVTGGSSGGSEDFARTAITAAGGRIDFAGINIKPGRPFAAGMIDQTPIFCIPGNPVAVFVTYRLLVAPALRRLGGGKPKPPLRFPVTCGFDAKHKLGRTDFIRVTLARPTPPAKNQDLPVAIPHGRFGAGVLTSVTGADGLLEISDNHGDVKTGDICQFIAF